MTLSSEWFFIPHGMCTALCQLRSFLQCLQLEFRAEEIYKSRCQSVSNQLVFRMDCSFQDSFFFFSPQPKFFLLKIPGSLYFYSLPSFQELSFSSLPTQKPSMSFFTWGLLPIPAYQSDLSTHVQLSVMLQELYAQAFGSWFPASDAAEPGPHIARD